MADNNTTNLNVEKTYTDPKTGKFVKGNPGGGRPEGSVSIVEGIKRKLLEVEPANKKTYLELFLSKLFLKAIKEGEILATIKQDNVKMGRDSISLLVDIINGKEVPKYIPIDGFIIDQSNVDEFLQ